MIQNPSPHTGSPRGVHGLYRYDAEVLSIRRVQEAALKKAVDPKRSFREDERAAS